MKNIHKWTEKHYKKMYTKYFRSRMWFIILNIISFALVASMVLLNVYAIKKNPFDNIKVYYVVIAILTGFIGLLTSLISFFTLNKNSNLYKEQYEEILAEYKEYKSKKGIYSSAMTRDETLIDAVQKITHL